MGVVSGLWGDLRTGARAVFSRPTFAAVVMLTLAVGVGVNVAVFSLAQQILLNRLPVSAPEELVNLNDPGEKFPGITFSSQSGPGAAAFSYPMFRDLEREQEPFVGIAAHRVFAASLSNGEEATRDDGFFVSGSYFSLLGLQPALGRLLGPEDDRVDGFAESVVLSHSYWQSAFGGNTEVIGRRLIVNGTPLTVVGVAPEGFHGTTAGVRASVFVPITFRGIDATFSIPKHNDRDFYWVYLFARLKPDVDLTAATEAMNPLFRSILTEIDAPFQSGVNTQLTVEQVDEIVNRQLVLKPGERGQSSLFTLAWQQLRLMFAVSGVVLLLCCANVAGLVLVRSTARTGEMAVRLSMGATSGRIASLMVSELLVLTVPAALASLPVAIFTLSGIANTYPGLPQAAFDVELSIVAALVSIGAAIVSAVLLGLLPTLGLIRTPAARALQSFATRQTPGKHVTKFRAGLATVQVALSMALLALAGIFAQSLANIGRIDLGFDADSLIVLSISPEASGYSPEQAAALYVRLEETLAAMPGVTSAGSSMLPLLSGGDLNVGASVRGDAGPVEGSTYVNWISPGYLQALDVELSAGRNFSAEDRLGAPNVVIVNQSFSERFGLNGNVIGRHMTIAGEMEIVGLIRDTKYDEVTDDMSPQVFMPLSQTPNAGSASFYVRSAIAPEILMQSIRETVARVDPIVPIATMNTMRDQIRVNVANERFVAGASTSFAVLATLLAGLGLYGVLAYSVAQRSREIGLRVALGAQSERIRGMVLRQVTGIAVIGIVLGSTAAWALSLAAESLLFSVGAGNPLALAAAAVVLVAVALAAAYIPARRAAHVDPMAALRYE